MDYSDMLLAVVLLALATVAQSQMIRQCTCQEFEPCKQTAVGNIMQCADQCQSHVTALGASYPALRGCIRSQEPMINAAIGCQSQQLAGACARSPGGMVPKRYPETLKIAAYAEINSMLARSGIQAEAKSFMSVGKKFASCIMKCMERGSGNCLKRLGCGLALPPDNVLVQSTKQCAIRSGFNTPAVRQLCQCVAGAGVRNLAPLCARITIS
ncbi:hypothetical protein ANCCAN_11938 [Ancylostoma caninum]|uniref:Uncharacterized protein n=1 Tax=Ancylostoma caninum TaxID=29170 RepID=A0A368GGY8_ANCCA|nr:hypothetical protein ANCCAN_11938 [Ancylostoma caninum]